MLRTPKWDRFCCLCVVSICLAPFSLPILHQSDQTISSLLKNMDCLVSLMLSVPGPLLLTPVHCSVHVYADHWSTVKAIYKSQVNSLDKFSWAHRLPMSEYCFLYLHRDERFLCRSNCNIIVFLLMYHHTFRGQGEKVIPMKSDQLSFLLLLEESWEKLVESLCACTACNIVIGPQIRSAAEGMATPSKVLAILDIEGQLGPAIWITDASWSIPALRRAPALSWRLL